MAALSTLRAAARTTLQLLFYFYFRIDAVGDGRNPGGACRAATSPRTPLCVRVVMWAMALAVLRQSRCCSDVPADDDERPAPSPSQKQCARPNS